ncbi:cryptochrome/photolyase family protein [Fodinicola feengrottensis]|uniref:Deoxyribodipyrimidine photo-lyase n=1 Tax=Fodinicola feengrottensis TaxID=435914 RepID=A0ABP4V5R3_9ACTN|nr:deoxyribodipyrimidine photo-lyase [Fodinicola feengrottensis]
MRTAVLLFTRDLRLHDNPGLDLARRSAERVVPLFVLHEGLRFAVPNRTRFLSDCLADLRDGLRRRGGDLVIRRGDPVEETIRLARDQHAQTVVVARDVSRYAKRREERLAAACAEHRISLRTVDSVGVVPPGAVHPANGDHYKVFTPYWRAWSDTQWRDCHTVPRKITLPDGIDAGSLPAGDGAGGGETMARRRMSRWLAGGIADYPNRHDDLPGDATSRLSADLHFGCLSPVELATKAGAHEAYVRQLCWRDFHLQVTAAFPDLPTRDYRPRRQDWVDDPDALAAWRAGQTGYPIIDAGLRQLLAEGFMHNRARMLVASFLTKQLNVHWTAGANHFFDLLVDGDIANNAGNWQWIAGTGNDTRPNRQFNPLRQAYRFDPDGDYVRRYVPELASVPGAAVHEPWKFGGSPGYPSPLVAPRA